MGRSSCRHEEVQGCSPLSGWTIDPGKEESPTEAGEQEADCIGQRRRADCLRAGGENLCRAAGISERNASAEEVSLMSLLETGSWVGRGSSLADGREMLEWTSERN